MAENNNPHGISVGQELWFVPAARHMGDPDFARVTKVGHKWATIKHRGIDLRIDLNTLRQDGRDISNPGKAHLSREIYETERCRNAAWNTLTRTLRNNYGGAPAGVTEQDIRAAAKLLGLDLEATGK